MSSPSSDGPMFILPQELVELIKHHPSQDLLLLDLRVFAQFSSSRISGALNLCIPTTLLKRSSYNVHRLSETFSNKKDHKAKFDSWKNAKTIVVYDAASWGLSEATSCVNILKKFSNEKWRGTMYILKGGFNAFAKRFPDQVDQGSDSETNGSVVQKLSIDPPSSVPMAGGCMIPSTHTAANPFFGTIRQNMDLIDGVGQMPVSRPMNLDDSALSKIPMWLGQAADPQDAGNLVADRFLAIEKAEQQRMQKALSGSVSWGTPTALSPNSVQITGFEKGTKNRYKDILPFDHSRVRLKHIPPSSCDYINASHIKPQGSQRHYIASQAPVPATFQDFWRLIWEQNARLVVMLTAESEGGQLKCHPYWLPHDYGLFQLKAVSERRQTLARTANAGKTYKSPLGSPTKHVDYRPGLGHPESPRFDFFQQQQQQQPESQEADPDKPYAIIRKLALTHVNEPFAPVREITQVQYSSWPDFGAPARPAELLGLLDICGSLSETGTFKGENPIVVHCSAGCGRTGTFCTIDSVVDMLKSQRKFRQHQSYLRQIASSSSRRDCDVGADEAWLVDDSRDLVASTVADFRLQRLSMVQTLRQYVLCYETVLEWAVSGN